MPMRYWTQYQAPGGNWVDALGTDNLPSARDFMLYIAQEQKQNARVVRREDTVIYEEPAKEAA